MATTNNPPEDKQKKQEKSEKKSVSEKIRVIFLSPHDSVRSQIAKGLLRKKYGDFYSVFSAGADPQEINDELIEVMDEVGIDISEQKPHDIDRYRGKRLFDYVVTLYDEPVETPPYFPGGKRYLHYDITHPPHEKTDEQLKIIYRIIREEIETIIEETFDPAKENIDRAELEYQATQSDKPMMIMDQVRDLSPINELIQPIKDFIRLRASSGIIIIICILLSLTLSNILRINYLSFWQKELSVSLGSWIITHTIQEWINDGLMTLFFFIVGLEIKREVIEGRLSDFKKAFLPVMAAIGGMIFPAVIYILFTYKTDAIRGWGIPVTTDIAIALGVLLLLGKRVNDSLRIFLTTFAVIDEIGGVLIIAIFYATAINWLALIMAIALFVIAIALNVLRVRETVIYLIIGFGMWGALLYSGINPILAGVFLAFTIPIKPRIDPFGFIEVSWATLNEYKKALKSTDKLVTNEDRLNALITLETAVQQAESPLNKLEHRFNLGVSYIILPLFILANSGLRVIGENIGQDVLEPISLGIMVGIIGKIVGICLFSFIAVITGIGKMPEGMTWKEVFGAASLGGIGFTTAIFMTELAFDKAEYIVQSKLGILISSIAAGVIGYLWLLYVYMTRENKIQNNFSKE